MAFYRQSLANRADRAAAIAGLGETGTREDIRLIEPYLASVDTRERAAAVRAVGKLAADDHVEALMKCLCDERPSVSKEACKALQNHVEKLAPERLWSMYLNDHRVHVRQSVLKLLDNFGAWEKLPYLIQAAADPEATIAARANSNMKRYCNHVFTKPDAEQRQRIESALAVAAGAVDRPLLRWLKDYLGLPA